MQERRRADPYMNFPRAGLPQHPHDLVARGAADDGIIDHNDTFPVNGFSQNIQLDADGGDTVALLGLDKGTAYISIFHKRGPVGNPGFHGISQSGGVARFGDAHDQIRLHGRILRQTAAGVDPGMVDADAVEGGVRPGEINIFEDTSGLPARVREAHAAVRLDAVPRDRHNLARLHIPDELRPDGRQRAGFRSQDIGIVLPADAERPEPEGIPRPDHLARTHDHQRIRARELLHGLHHRLLDVLRTDPRAGDQIGDHLRIDGCLENGPVIRQFAPEFGRIEQIAVMGQGQSPLDIVQNQRLRIFTAAAAGRGIAHMAHANVAVKGLQRLRPKDLVAQPHALVDADRPLGAAGIADRDAAALLPPVLEGK